MWDISKVRDCDKYFKNELFIHNVFEMSNALTNDLINRSQVINPVNKYLFREITKDEYIVFALKEFSAFRVKFREKCFDITMKDGVTVTFDILETAEFFDLHPEEEKNVVTFIPEKEMLTEFLKCIKGLCRMELKTYMPTIQECRQIMKDQHAENVRKRNKLL